MHTVPEARLLPQPISYILVSQFRNALIIVQKNFFLSLVHSVFAQGLNFDPIGPFPEASTPNLPIHKPLSVYLPVS